MPSAVGPGAGRGRRGCTPQALQWVSVLELPHGAHWPLPAAEVTTVRVAAIPAWTRGSPPFSENLLETSVLDQEQHHTVLYVSWGHTSQEPEDNIASRPI